MLDKRDADPAAAYRTEEELRTKALHTLAIAYASAHRLVDAKQAALLTTRPAARTAGRR